jgi:hypothetical protein
VDSPPHGLPNRPPDKEVYAVRRLIPSVVVVLLVALIGWLTLVSYQVTIPPAPTSPSQPPPPTHNTPPPMRAAYDPLQFDHLSIDIARLNHERTQQIAALNPDQLASDPDIQKLEKAVLSWGWMAHQAALPSTSPLITDLSSTAQSLTDRFGPAVLAWIIENARNRFESALSKRIANPPPSPSPLPTPAQAAATLGTSLISVGLQVQPFIKEVIEPESLLVAQNQGASLWPLIGILFRYQWSQRLCGSTQPCLLTPYETLILRRWQIERSRASLSQKLKIIQRWKAEIPNYDWLRAEVILLAQEGLIKEAKDVVNAALSAAPTPEQAERARALLSALDAR